MEASSPSVQCQHFQLSQLFRSDVEKDAGRKKGEEREMQSRSRRQTWSRILRQSLLQRRVRVHQIVPVWVLRAPSQQGSNLIAQRAGKPAAGSSNQNDAASSSPVWLTDVKMNVRGNSLLQERIRIRVFKNVQGNLPQKSPYINEDDSEWRIFTAYFSCLRSTS